MPKTRNNTPQPIQVILWLLVLGGFFTFPLHAQKKPKTITTYHFRKLKKSEGVMHQDKKQGLWKYWHPDGKIKRIENYKDGVLDGVFMEYYENKEYYLPDRITGKFYKKYLLPNQKKQLRGPDKVKGNYKNGKKSGTWHYWNYKGYKYLLRNYRNDTIHGMSKEFLSNGKPLEEVEYKNGVKDGYIKLWKYGKGPVIEAP